MKLTKILEKDLELAQIKKVASKDRFRLSISRSAKNISAQIIDDTKELLYYLGSSVEKDIKNSKLKKVNYQKLLLKS